MPSPLTDHQSASVHGHVRGVLCRHCNWKIVHSRLTADMARRIASYLEAYELRRDA